MKFLLTILILLTMTFPSLAHDFGPAAPVKPAINPPQNVPGDRQGGDTIADAVLVTIPVVDLTGTTTGYTDDYDEVCPYTNSTSPDVVYTFFPNVTGALDFDMLGSAYDTKIYIYDADLTMVACNDDYYADYTSRLEAVPMVAGAQYYLVIDGYGGDHGEYLLNIYETVPCEIICPSDAELEGEPPLTIDYEDTFNGGCGDGGTGGWRYWDSPDLCAVSGFYLYMGSNYRDTDWFEIPIGPAGVLEIEGDAERPTYMFELAPQDCNYVEVVQNVSIGPCTPATITILGEPGSIVWFWVGPQDFESPDGSDVYEYTYYLINHTHVVAVEDHSWSNVKALFR